MKKILLVLISFLIFSSCSSSWIGNGNDFVITRIEYSRSANEYRVYIKGVGLKREHYFYTTERYRIGDTLTLTLK